MQKHRPIYIEVSNSELLNRACNLWNTPFKCLWPYATLNGSIVVFFLLVLTSLLIIPFFEQSQTVAIGLKKSINLTSSLDDIWRNHSLDYIAFR